MPQQRERLEREQKGIVVVWKIRQQWFSQEISALATDQQPYTVCDRRVVEKIIPKYLHVHYLK